MGSTTQEPTRTAQVVVPGTAPRRPQPHPRGPARRSTVHLSHDVPSPSRPRARALAGNARLITRRMGARALVSGALVGGPRFGDAARDDRRRLAWPDRGPADHRDREAPARRPLAIRRDRPGSFDCSGLVLYSLSQGRRRASAQERSPALGPCDLRVLPGAWQGQPHEPEAGRPRRLGRRLPRRHLHRAWVAISTLTSGVRIHRVHAVTARFTTYLHTGVWKSRVAKLAPQPTATPKPAPTPTSIPTPTQTPTPLSDPPPRSRAAAPRGCRR